MATLATPREEEPQIVVPMADVFVTAPGLRILTHAVIPLNQRGLRTNVGFTVGLEYNF
jgi:hypothetical protein